MGQIICGLLGIMQFVLIAYILYKEVTKKSSAVFLWATLFLMFAGPHLITSISINVNYSVSVISQASLFVTLFCLLYILVRNRKDIASIQLERGDKFEIEPSQITGSFLESLFFFIFVISMMLYMLNIIRGQGGILNTSWATRSVDANYVSIWGLLVRIIFMFSGLMLYYFLTNRRIHSFVVLILFFFLIVLTRNRVHMIPILIFPVTLFIMKIRRIRLKHIILASLLAVAVIYIVYGVRAFRYMGTLSNALSEFSWEKLNSQIMSFINSKNGELGLRQDFYYFIQNNNQFEGFNRGVTYIRMLLVFIPSQWSLGLKPQSFDLYMGQAVGMISGGTTHPTIFGDCFGNMNWFGILLGAFWAFYANCTDRLIVRQNDSFYKIMYFYLSSYAFIVMGRGSVYNGFEVFAWGVLLLSLLKFSMGKLSNVKFVFGKYHSVSHEKSRRE